MLDLTYPFYCCWAKQRNTVQAPSWSTVAEGHTFGWTNLQNIDYTSSAKLMPTNSLVLTEKFASLTNIPWSLPPNSTLGPFRYNCVLNPISRYNCVFNPIYKVREHHWSDIFTFLSWKLQCQVHVDTIVILYLCPQDHVQYWFVTSA